MKAHWRVFGILGATALAQLAMPLPAAGQKNLRTNRIAIEYKAAEQPAHKTIEESLKQRRVLETVAQMLGPVRLPRRLTMRIMSCGGKADAYYNDDVITVCYEYFELIMTRFGRRDVPEGTTLRNLLIGATADAFFHEFAHAAFDMLEIPVFGREEDAADQFSAYVLLNFSRNDAFHLITGAVSYFARDPKEAKSKAPGLEEYSNEHSLPEQRFFNYICLAYGLDPKRFAVAVERAKLTKGRAEQCAGEYRQVERAFRKLIFPYVDRRALDRARAKTRFNLDPVD